ncbi:hypothetical protein AVEN_46079-1 [Araneus ventricosus]|uniref:Uncharacterized protein n=1 Tax=Araneus ventricosus TaxID=182803 RepID=A0A4Y2RM26_ARAVE|nr:hypothetical protein AVEN_46079-1 [Araneus ventricosus]
MVHSLSHLMQTYLVVFVQKETVTTRRPFETQLIPSCFRHKGTLSSFAMVRASEIPLLDTLLEQQRIVFARGFLGLLEHSEKMLSNDGWKSQYSSLRVFLIVYRSWDTDLDRIQSGNISPTTQMDHQRNRALDRRVHLLRREEIRNVKQVWDNNRAMLKSPKLLKNS